MVSFELGIEIEKDAFLVYSHVWDKEKILGPHGRLNLKPLDSTLWCSTTEPKRLHAKQDHVQSSHDMCPACC